MTTLARISVDEITQYIEDNNPDASGCFCEFYKITEDIGVKLFINRKERDKAYSMQKEVYFKSGLAPEPGFPFNMECHYGYTTEIVEVLCHPDDSRSYKHKIAEKYEAEMDQVLEDLRNYGIIYRDDHVGNFGINKQGQLIIIDFSF